MEKKILYLMHIDWNWIKQRPQYIAQELARTYQVSVLYKYRYQRNIMQDGKISFCEDKLEVRPIYRIPIIERWGFGKKINKGIIKRAIYKKIKKLQPEFIYITEPEQVEFLPKDNKTMIIYDCMDNHAAFCEDVAIQKKIVDDEKKLAKLADCICISSQNLKNVFIERYGKQVEEKSILVRNGYNGKVLNTEYPKKTNNKFVITYIGTVSSWFDTDIIKKSLQDFDNVIYEIYGPVDNSSVQVEHERVIYKGTVAHEELPEVVKGCDCLIMPFKLNDVVTSVDPVKFYEYINFNRNIISVYYEEIERFTPYVEFYHNYEEYRQVLSKLMVDNTVKYSEQKRTKLLEDSTWNSRVKLIQNYIDKH